MIIFHGFTWSFSDNKPGYASDIWSLTVPAVVFTGYSGGIMYSAH